MGQSAVHAVFDTYHAAIKARDILEARDLKDGLFNKTRFAIVTHPILETAEQAIQTIK